MRMTFKSVAIAVAIVTAGLTAAPAMARSAAPAEVVLVRDHGPRADRHDRGRYERRHHSRAERRHGRDRFYDGRRYDRYSRHDRDYRRDRHHRRGNGVVIRLN